MNPAVYYLSTLKESKVYVPTPVQIGEQIWDNKNLDATYYTDGTKLQIATGSSTLPTKTIGACGWYANDPANSQYGRLYNFAAVTGNDGTGIAKSLAPAGWRIATNDDWNALYAFSVSDTRKLREAGTAHWTSGNTGNNSLLFTAFGGGYILTGTGSTGIGIYGYWWTPQQIVKRMQYNGTSLIDAGNNTATNGCSIRLIRIPAPATNFITSPPTSVTAETMYSGGIFQSGFNYTNVTERGLVWGTSLDPTFTSNIGIAYAVPLAGTTNYTDIQITGLSANTTYHIRAWFISNGVRYYGTDVSQVTTAGGSSLTTNGYTAISYQTSAFANGVIADSGGYAVNTSGICWSTSNFAVLPSSPIPSTKTTNGYSGGIVTNASPQSCGAGAMTGLLANTNYNVRAYATTTTGNWFGELQTVTTLDASIELETTSIGSNFTFTTALSGGTIIDVNGTTITQKGICWNTSSNPTISNSKTIEGASYTLGEPFSSTATVMYPATSYFVRAYASNVYTTSYGNEVTVTTATPNISITTDTTSALNAISVSCGATAISNPDGYTITQVGFCWGLTSNVTKGGSNFVSNGSLVTAPFTLNTGNVLVPETGYYIRAYAIIGSLSNYIVYGSPTALFTTLSATPTVTTNAVTTFNAQSITAGGSVTLTKGVPVLDKGLCWAVSPTIPTKGASNFTNAGAGEGTFSSTINGLTFGTPYNIRAYSTNAYGALTYYATNTISQTTYTPEISIETVTDINPYPLSITCGGNSIFDDTTYPITEKGYCYSSSVNPPTIANTKILAIPQTGTASFTRISGALTPNVSYFVSAYALNSTTGFVDYGSPVIITTPNDDATATTTSVTALTYQSATVNYTIGAGSYYPIITRGVCWSTSENPTNALATKIEISGGSGGNFSANLTGLNQSTKYYVRAYVTNAVGTVYSTGSITELNTEFNQVLRYAYSLRKVVDGYLGNAILVRRSSDNATQGIGFTGNDLNEAALLTWVGAGDGFVVTWYDQSGNSKDITNATNARQPRIVSSITGIERSGARPAVRFVAANLHTLTRADTTIALNNMSNYTVLAPTSTTSNRNPFGLNATTRFYLPYISSGVYYTGWGSSAVAINMGAASSSIVLFSSLTAISGGITVWKNNVGAGSTSALINNGNSTSISLGAFGATNYYDGYISEIRGYTGLSDRTNISTNINSYYTIY